MNIFKKPLKNIRADFRYLIKKHKCMHITSHLSRYLSKQSDEIPVFIVSYNNGIYVENMVRQLNSYGIKPIIFDNHTTCKNSLGILNHLHSNSYAHVIYSKHNFGHMIGFLQPIYDVLPEEFVYTDPDLQLNSKLPKNFLDILKKLTIEYSVFKAGFALSLKGHGKIKDIKLHCLHTRPIKYDKHQSILEFESKHWKYRLQHDALEVYAAPIDTTFALYKKSNYIGDFYRAVRVAGDFSAIHLPWFEDIDPLTDNDKKMYLKRNTSSNWIK